MRPVAAAILALAVTACAPPACSDVEERSALLDVQLLVREDGPVAAAAEDRLVERGRRVIALVETGLYAAEAPARRRIVRTLARIGSPEAAPILQHLARRDPDPEVREAAQAALTKLPAR